MQRFVGIEQEYLGSIWVLGVEPLFGQVNKAATVDEHEHLDRLVVLGLLDSLLEFGVSGDWVNFVLDALASEEFLGSMERYCEHLQRAQGVNVDGGVNDHGNVVDVDLVLDFLVDVYDLVQGNGHLRFGAIYL